MPTPNGPHFVTLYRGLAGVSHPDELDPELIGPHWTHKKERAEEFAGPSGSVVSAQIPSGAVMYNGRTGEERSDFRRLAHNDYSAVYRVMPEEGEEETFVTPHVPVRITEMWTHPQNPIRDKWSFEKPLVRSTEKLYAYDTDEHGDIAEWHKGES